MRKKAGIALFGMAAALCLAFTFAFAATGAETVYDADKVFSAGTAPLSYGEDGSIQVGDGNAAVKNQVWTNPGQYSFPSPFSVRFRLNGIPTEQSERKDSYFFLTDAAGSENRIWFNFAAVPGESKAILNISIDDVYLMADNFPVTGFDLGAAQSVTIAYDGGRHAASLSFAETVFEFDLTKNAQGGVNERLAELPTGAVKVGLMNTHGGIVVEKINGVSFRYEKPDVGFAGVPNLEDDFIGSDDAAARIAYGDGGISVGNGDPASAATVGAGVQPKYGFEGVVDLKFRFDGLQPAQNASRKSVYFILHNAENPSAQIVIKFFAYCTSDDAATADYILHVEAFTGQEGTGQYFAQSKNLLWSVKDFENVSLRVKYDAQKKVVKLFKGEEKIEIDLTKRADGTDADTSVLPAGTMGVQMILQHGGIVLEQANAWLFRFDRSDFEVHYTDRTDFFLPESTARVVRRNGGILITNNDKTNVDYLTALADPKETYSSGNMIFEFRFDSLQTYVPSEPLSIMKAVWFDVADTEGRRLEIQPFLYQSGNSRLLHINVRYDGKMIYENHIIDGYDFSDYENQTLSLKYNSQDKTLEIGSDLSRERIDLSRSFNGKTEGPAVDTSKLPAGTLLLESVRVQFGGIYLRRINQYSFVVENPETPDPVDAEIADFGLPLSTFDRDVEIRPTIERGDFPDAELKIFYRLPESDSFEELASANGVWSFSFGEFGTYSFRYELTFDSVTLTTVKQCEYKSTLIDSLGGLFKTVSGTTTVVDEGIKVANRDPAVEDLVYANGTFEIAGTTTVRASIVELPPAGGAAPSMKQLWVDFSDGTNGVWVNVFAFSASGTAGRFPAYCSVFTFKNGDKGTQIKLAENVALNFNFDLPDGTGDPSAVVEVTYEPSKGLVTVGKAGEQGTAFDLVGRQIPKGKFSVNLAATYGSWILRELGGFSLANESGAFDFPKPVVDLDSIPGFLVVGEKLAVPKSAVYDLFDLRPEMTVSLKGADGTVVPLLEEPVDGIDCFTAVLGETGKYELTIGARNKRELAAQEKIVIQVIEEDLEAPVMTFAENAFSAYRKGDRENKFEVKKDTRIELPTPTLSDDSGLPIDLKVTVTDPRGKISIVNGMKFTGDTIGTYKVEYAATDVSGKETRAIYNFIVKLNWEEETGGSDQKTGCGCGSLSGGAGRFGGGALLLALAALPLVRKKRT